jgi:hypothetical protein
MNTGIKFCVASMLTLCLATPVLAQNARQGDYYNFQPWTPQQVSPGQERRIQQGDYYRPVATVTTQQNSPRDAAIHKCVNAAHRAVKALSQTAARTEYYMDCMGAAGFQP